MSTGALYLTNIQQLYPRADPDDEEPDAMTGVLGSKPPVTLTETVPFKQRIAARGVACMVINDEAHHTHDEGSQWNEVIRAIHDSMPGGLVGQLDFSATPRYAKGGLFTWTVFDYPLKQAIIDGLVKRPMKGSARGIQEQPSEYASTKYRAYLTAGVERWREYRVQLAPARKKPVLFVMMNSTADADDVGEYMRTKYPAEFGDEKLLIIHTDKSGDVSKKDLEPARRMVRDVDLPESPVNAIVSVLMLREGWDVQNVTVVVGLRPFSSKANILPEQTVGRGLRRMFRDAAADFVERLDVIGNRPFIAFVEQLEKDEGLTLDTFVIGKDPLRIATVLVDQAKLDKDIVIPVLSPALTRKTSLADLIEALDVTAFKTPTLPVKLSDAEAQAFHYEGYDLLSLEKLLERDYSIPEPQTAQEVISYYARRIAQDLKLPSQFAVLAPKVREFLQVRAFGKKVNLESKEMIRAISSNVAQYVTVKSFVAALRGVIVEEHRPELQHAGRWLSETLPFPFSRQMFSARKTVFNLVAVDNEFEHRFARFLEDAHDVDRFAKLPERFGFAIDYVDSVSNLRYYEPDFIAVLTDSTQYLIETKGREDPDVAYKDRAAELWCANATALTGTQWRFVKVPQKEHEKLDPSDFADLKVFAS